MERSSFNLLVPNLFVGLTKGARGLGEPGRRFKQLGYRIFRLEPTFLLTKGGRCNPDLVLCSEKMGHTLILEWTNAASVYEDKKEQFRKYSRITRTDVVNGLVVPRKEAGSFDIVVVVPREAVSPFSKFLSDDRLPFVLLEFTGAERQYTLHKVSGTLQTEDTERFFSKPLSLNRIPLRYVPFPLENMSASELVTHVVTHILSLMTKGVTEFTVDEFCSGYVAVWAVLDPKKRGEISRATKKLIDALARKPIGVELLRRQQSDSPTWQLLRSSTRQTQPRSLRDRLDEFIAEVRGGAFQLELDLDAAPPLEVRYDRQGTPEDSS